MSGANFGQFSNALLVNNFGDGTVSAFKTDGTFLGQMKDPNGMTDTIDGIWSIMIPDPTITNSLDPNTAYFAAGQQEESHGMFGYIKPSGSGYMVTKLVADTAGFGAARIDPNLVNGWGIAITSTGSLWVSSNGPGLGLNYDGNGNPLMSPVTIPARKGTGGTPSGAIFNTTTDFHMPK
jgi:hypothetical protein